MARESTQANDPETTQRNRQATAWIRRGPAILVALLLVVVTTGVLTWRWREARKEASRQRLEIAANEFKAADGFVEVLEVRRSLLEIPESHRHQDWTELWESTYLTPFQGSTRVDHPIIAAAVGDNGKQLVTLQQEGVVQTWELPGLHPKQEFSVWKKEKNTTGSVCRFSTDGRLLACSHPNYIAGELGEALIFDIQTQDVKTEFLAEFNQIVFAPDDSVVYGLIGHEGQRIGAWNTGNGEPLFTIPGKLASGDVLVVSDDGRRLYDLELRQVYDARTGRQLEGSKLQGVADGRRDIVALSTDGRYVASLRGSASGSQPTLVLECTDQLYQQEIQISERPAHVTFSPDGREIACVVSHPNLDVEVLELAEDSFAMGMVGAMMSVGLKDRPVLWDVHVYDVPTGEHLRTLRGFPSVPYDLIFSPDGTKLVVYGGIDKWRNAGSKQGVHGDVVLWDLAGARSSQTPLIQDETVEYYIEALDDDDVIARREAAKALGELGRGANESATALGSAIQDDDRYVRRFAARALVNIGPEVAAPQFVESLHHDDPLVRQDAVYAFAQLSMAASVSAPALIESLHDEDEHVRRFAAQALGQLGSQASAAVTDLIGLLNDDSKQVRRAAANSLGAIGSDANAAVSTLSESLRDQDPYLRRIAIEALRNISPDAAVPAFIEALQDEDVVVKERAAAALATNDVVAASTALALIDFLQHTDRDIRDAATSALVKIGPEAVPPLVSRLDDEKRDYRAAAATALGALGPTAKSAIPALIEALKDEDRRVQSSAAQSLHEIGPEAIPELMKLFREERPRVGFDAGDVLSKFGSESVPILVDAINDEDHYFRRRVIILLGRIGANAKTAVPALVAVLNEQNDSIRVAAAGALGRIGIDAAPAEPALTGLLQDDEKSVRYSAAIALGRIGVSDEEVVRTLGEAIQHGTTEVKRFAADALGGTGAAAEPILLDTLNDRDPFVQVNASRSLGKIDAKEKALAVPVLLEWIEAPSDLGHAAASSFGELGSAETEAVPELVAIFNRGRGASPSQNAARALSQIGAAAVPALVRLLEVERTSHDANGINDIDSSIKKRLAAQALGRIGSEAQSAVPALRNAMKSNDVSVVEAAARALNQIASARAEISAIERDTSQKANSPED
ncbi:HEAT repeat domain-containing protein [Aeoliella sp. ICT_H6.2]|uniref:HEAT repeat domain-containing protein n=1 Tax=Aeoliella straminimaris TaxID=2954799 RepID=A0A9X2F6K0_9BACT|nr:HEAT repeat domain-containing protein [Aeoliella straminimaris]MCO6042714.1 HEAT repeat domain-containing protein [Aeoliella straminimaris]